MAKQIVKLTSHFKGKNSKTPCRREAEILPTIYHDDDMAKLDMCTFAHEERAIIEGGKIMCAHDRASVWSDIISINFFIKTRDEIKAEF